MRITVHLIETSNVELHLNNNASLGHTGNIRIQEGC